MYKENYDELMSFGTARQCEYAQAIKQEGNITKAAEKLGVNPSTISRSMKSLKKSAAKRGWSPEHDMTKVTAEGFDITGTSTLYDDEGNVKIQWVKTGKAKEQAEQLMEVFQDFATDFSNVYKPIKPSKAVNLNPNLINVIPMGDPHVGLYCWQMEVGNDFDCDIAESLMVSSVDHLVHNAPSAAECLIINLGDFFHADTADGVTLRSGHKLDVDTRWNRVLEIGVRAFRRSIDKALEYHERVTVMSAIGNHDDHSAQFLNIVLREYYRDEPRVHVIDNKTVFQYYSFGKNLFGVTHGHTVRADSLEAIMARDCNELWSETQFRKWFIGHFHSQRVHDKINCNIEYYRTLAPGDAWSIASGYRSERDMRCETYHIDNGFVGMTRFDPIMLG